MPATIKLHRSTNARFGPDGGEATLTYQVTFPNDQWCGVAAVLQLNAAGFVQGTVYQYGKITHTKLTLQEMIPRAGKAKHVYYVDCVYRSPPPPELQNEPQQPPGGLPTPPERARPFVRAMARARQEAVHKSLFLGCANAAGEAAAVNNNRMPKDKMLPVTNSAEVPLLPPRERLVYDWALIVTDYTTKIWEDVPDLLGRVNSKKVQLRTVVDTQGGGTRKQFESIFAARTLLLYDEQWDPHVVGGVPWNVVTREVLWREAGWYVDELDRGLCARAQRGDPDGSGGTYSQSDVTGPNGVNVRRLLDHHGNPISEPILLDGKGQPLDIEDPERAVFLRWLDQAEADFATLQGPWS